MDITRDTNYSYLHRVLRDNADAADFVKEAQIPEQDEWDQLPTTAFADVDNRAYPVHTPKMAAVSILYANAYGVNDPEVVNNLKLAAVIYDLDEKLFSVRPVPETFVSAEPLAYLLPSISQYPVYDSDTVKLAEEFIVDHYGNMLLDDRLEYCDNLVKIADDLNVDISEDVYKIAGKAVMDTRHVRDMVFARKAVTREPEAKAAYEKVASMLADFPAEVDSLEIQDRVLNVIDQVDKLAGFEGRYSRKIPEPRSLVYTRVKKAANRHVITMGPYQITATKLAYMDPDVLGDIIGDDMVSEMTNGGDSLEWKEAADILPTLPADMQRLVAKVFRL